jgi:predicted Zn-dependent protease
MRKLNLVFLAQLVGAVVVLCGGVHVAHQIMVSRNAKSLLSQARRAESASDLKNAESLLALYLNLNRHDGEAWDLYVKISEREDKSHTQRDQVFLVHEQALRYNPSSVRLERRCAELALELDRYTDAERHLKRLIERVADRSHGHPVGAELAELEELEGQCARRLAHFEEAEALFVRALANDPHRVTCYNRLARLRRVDLRRIEAADATIREMVETNPQSGVAYIYKWRYDREFRSPDAGDVEKGLKLAPDDPDVLLAAAIATEEQSGPKAARVYYERGFNLNPESFELAARLARVEVRENRLDRAEAVLRRAHHANPSLPLAFLLAKNLIDQGKVEGKDQAGDYIALLRNAGLGNTLVKYLEAELSFQRKQWADAIRKIEIARALLGADPELVANLNFMLAECYRQVGDDEQRLDALQQAAENDYDQGSARGELALELARSGKLDRALGILLPLAERKAEWRLDLARLVLRRAIGQPKERRNWQEVERYLQQAEAANSHDGEKITLLRAQMLVAHDRLDDALALLSDMQTKEPRNLKYRLARARLVQRQGQGASALLVLDQAEKELGSSPELRLARLEYWAREGGAAASAAVAKLAETRLQMAPASRRVFLDQLALVELQRGAIDLARQYWRELAVLEPDNLGVRARLVDLALAAGDRTDAAALIDQIRSSEGDGGTVWRFAQAEVLIDGIRRGASVDQKALDEVRALAALISERRPQWASSFVLNGQIADLAGLPDQAIANYQRAIGLGNLAPWLLRRLVGLLEARNRLDEIERLAELLRDQEIARGTITIASDLERQYLAQFANYWIDRNRLDWADQWLAKLKQAEPRGLFGLEAEARLLDVRNRKAELLALLQARVRELPEQVGTVAGLLERYGFKNEAEEAYKKYVALDAKEPQRALALAKFLARQGRASQAFEIFQKSWSVCRSEDVAAAALILYDANPVDDTQRQQVAAWVTEAVAQRPDNALLAGKLGIIRVRDGRFDEAETLFRGVLSRSPANLEALNNLAWVLAIQNRAKAPEALALIDRAVAITGEAAELADTRAVARIQLGQFDRAVAELVAVRKQSPANPAFALHLAWAYQARGQNEQAHRELQEAEKLGLRPEVLDPFELGILKRLRNM